MQRFADGRPGIVEPGDLAPLLASRQHCGQQARQARHIVVEMGERDGDRPGMFPGPVAGSFEMIQRPPRGFLVMSSGLLRHGRLRAETRQEGHLPRQAGTQRVDGGQAQAPWLGFDLPAELAGARQGRARQAESDALVRGFGYLAAPRRVEALRDAAAHLAGRLVGEGDGDDFLGLVDSGQEAQVALRQQLGLARARRRLDDEGVELQRAAAVLFVFPQQLAH